MLSALNWHTRNTPLTLTPLTWSIWWVPNNTSRWDLFGL